MKSIKGRNKYNDFQGGTFLSLSRNASAVSKPAIILVLITLILNTFSSLLPTQNAQAAGDWLTGWSYRKPVNIESDAATLTDYQVKLDLQGNDPTAVDYLDFSKVKSDGSDIRFTESDKTTLIPYYLESWNASAKTATVWLKLSEINITGAPTYFYFSVPEEEHDNYGLAYPITYEFDIPAGSSNLKAYRKYSSGASWSQITEKTSADFFNGIEAARFDYTSNKAYVSVAFSADTEDLYIKIDNTSGTQVATYNTISKYYDNRTATVTSSWDDWSDGPNTIFKTASNMFVSKHLSYTPAIITGSCSAGTWADIQTYINTGYLEPASHTRTHPNLPYADYNSEIIGSRDDIINNLDLSPLSKKGSSEYVYTFIEPGGQSDATSRATIGIAKYLVDRSTTSDGMIDYALWDSINGLYNKFNYTIRIGDDGTVNTATLNASFDSTYAAGGIYHLMMHPTHVVFTAGQYADLHTTYISDRKDVWYAGLGYLYQYLFTKDRAQERHPISGKQIYVYYGKDGSSTTSNFDNTFTKHYSSDSNLAAQWHADEGSGATSVDSSGNSNTCNLTSTTWSGSDGGRWGSDTLTHFTTGSAFDLDGANNRIDCGNGASLNFTGNYSIEFWAKSTEAKLGSVVAKADSSTGSGNGFYIVFNTNMWKFSHFYAATVATATQSASINVWYHVVGIYDGSKIILYVNGVPSTATSAPSFNPAPAQNLKIGILSYTSAFRFKGSIDEVRIYSRALSSDEINAHYWRSKYSSLEPTIGITQAAQEETAPSITALSATNATSNNATLNGNITSTGGLTPTVRGFKYYQSSNCSGTENNISESGSFGTGAYSLNLTNLPADASAYSYKAYAINEAGTGTSTNCVAISSTPNISGPTVIFNDNSATVSWTTDESSTSRVDYGFTENYVSMTEDTSRVTQHNVGLTDLMPCHQYHYRVYSKDEAGNERFSTDNTFTTQGCPAPRDTGSWRYFSYATSASSGSSSSTQVSAIPSSGTMDSSIRFDASNLFPGKSITKYIWDFGDSKTDEGRIVNHKYSSPGRYTIKVTGFDKDGNEYVFEQSIDISPETPTIKNITSTNDTDLIIEGSGFKGDTIYLSIHSTPMELTSSVDDTGYWSYTINNASETLGEGDHTASAIDSYKLADNTELKSSATDETKFSFTVDNGKLKVEMEKSNRYKTIIYVLIGLIVVGAIIFFMKRKSRRWKVESRR